MTADRLGLFANPPFRRLLVGREEYEHVLRAVVGLNKAVALLGIEPLHGSDRHCLPSRNQEIPPAQDERRGQTATLNGEQVRRSIARGKSKPNDEEVDFG